MPNGPLKLLNSCYEVLQLDISNFRSTGRLTYDKDKSCQTWQCNVGQLALKWTFKLQDEFSQGIGIMEK